MNKIPEKTSNTNSNNADFLDSDEEELVNYAIERNYTEE